MEVIRWDFFWEDYKIEFEEEVNFFGGVFGDWVVEDFCLWVIEYVWFYIDNWRGFCCVFYEKFWLICYLIFFWWV